MGSYVISVIGSPEQIRKQVALDFRAEWLKEDEFPSPLQDAFDQTDRPKIYNGLGCSIFLAS